MIHHPVPWAKHHKIVRELHSMIITQLSNLQRPTDIVAIGRGGLVPGTLIANFLGIHRLYNYGIASYDQNNKQQPPTIFQDLPPHLDIPSNRILIIDDLLDTGSTMMALTKKFQYATVQTATLYVKDNSVLPENHFYIERVSSAEWVVFPWEIYDGI